MEKKYVVVEIDGQNLNARYIAGMAKADAVAKLQADFKDNKDVKVDAAWAGKAYDLAVAKVAEADAPKEAAKK